MRKYNTLFIRTVSSVDDGKLVWNCAVASVRDLCQVSEMQNHLSMITTKNPSVHELSFWFDKFRFFEVDGDYSFVSKEEALKLERLNYVAVSRQLSGDIGGLLSEACLRPVEEISATMKQISFTEQGFSLYGYVSNGDTHCTATFPARLFVGTDPDACLLDEVLDEQWEEIKPGRRKRCPCAID
jgi:hypothetical protein